MRARQDKEFSIRAFLYWHLSLPNGFPCHCLRAHLEHGLLQSFRVLPMYSTPNADLNDLAMKINNGLVILLALLVYLPTIRS